MILISAQSQLSQYSLKLRQHILSHNIHRIIQKSISGTSATGALFTVQLQKWNIESVTVTDGGTAYNIADDLQYLEQI